MKYALVIFISIAASGIAPAAAPPAQQQEQQQQQRARPAARENYSDRYSILTERNIFLRDRSKGSSRGGGTTSASTQATPRSPEETHLLRGIVIEQGEVRAYFEDIANSLMVRVAEGDQIARGRIASIGLDAVEYESNANGGRRTFVVVGNDLTGKASALDGSTGDAMATTGPVMPSGLEGLDPNDPNLTMEQRLKIRRLQELKK